MFEARLQQGSLLKKIVEAIKDLIEDANFECNNTGFTLQAMDSSHVSLVALNLRSDTFEHYRCDRNVSMGMKLMNLSKILKCATNDDTITMKSEDTGDTITFVFEAPNQDRLSEFDLKLMDIDSEQLGIPDSEYEATVTMPASEFARICKDLSTIGDTVELSANKDAVKFATSGDIGSANVLVRQNKTADSDEFTEFDIKSPVCLNFALRYMNSFAKASSLSRNVKLSMSKELPIRVEFQIEDNAGSLCFYLAPKLEDEMDEN